MTTGNKAIFDTEVEIKAPEGELKNDSIILLNQIRTIDKTRIVAAWGTLTEKTMLKLDNALKISLGLINL